MGLRINNNLESFNAHRTLSKNALALSNSMAKLSSGLRINTASDDAAGLSISERMRAQINGYAQASRNAQDGISLAQTAEGALNEVSSMLQRIRDLAVQHSNGTNDTVARTAIEREGAALVAEINRVITGTSFNGLAIINNAAAITLQVGPSTGNTLTVTGVTAAAATGANTTALNTMFPGTGAGTMNLTTIDNAIAGIAGMRGQFAAAVNRLDYAVNANGVAQENLMAAESRIRDVDMAQEMANMTRLQILQESGVAMLAQSNMQQSSVLKLLS